MAGTRTYGDLKARIADELIRPDLSSQIALAVQDAILEASGTRFWFNEVRGLTLPLVIGQEYYTSTDISALTQIDDAWIVVGGGRRTVFPIDNILLDEMIEGGPFSGEPYRYSRYGDSLRFYPYPGDTYTLYLNGVSQLSPLVNDADLNGWTNEGERLIRAIAKRELLIHVIQDTDAAQVQQLLAERYKKDLLQQSYDRAATGQMAYNG